jgi:ubiquinone/menaquinone biosynthesis C-methylase UbiE
MSLEHEVALQRQYYAQTSQEYDAMHVHQEDEHYFSLGLLLAAIDHFGFRSVLDVGSGTGRAVAFLKQRRPHLRVVGVEPVRELREAGHAQGLSESDLVDGDATALQFESGSFDVVCEFGVLHHIRRPETAVAEMLRVAKMGIFISDSNNFGQGGTASRLMKQAFNALGLWKVADYVKTRGRGYTISEGDGLFYSYSVFNNYRQLRQACQRLHIMNTMDGGINPYRTAPHVAVLGIKHGVELNG